MIHLIIGGSGSGKSAYAEEQILKLLGARYYIATMQVYDAEGEEKIARHRMLRKDKKFITIEQPRDVAKIETPQQKDACALLECMSNLVANEMFQDNRIVDADTVVRKVTEEIAVLSEKFKNLIIVTNNISEDGKDYDTATMEYLKALGQINAQIAKTADYFTEVVVGIPVQIKKREDYDTI